MEGEQLLVGIIPVGNLAQLPMQDVMLGIQDVLRTAGLHQKLRSHIRCGLIVSMPLPIPKIAWNDDRKKHNTDPFFNLAR